jgi:hypothetical protein
VTTATSGSITRQRVAKVMGCLGIRYGLNIVFFAVSLSKSVMTVFMASACHSPIIFTSTRLRLLPSNSPVEDLFPGTKIKFSIRDCDDDFTTHYLSFEMRIGIVFTCSIVLIL